MAEVKQPELEDAQSKAEASFFEALRAAGQTPKRR
jgi:hypothetical protein